MNIFYSISQPLSGVYQAKNLLKFYSTSIWQGGVKTFIVSQSKAFISLYYANGMDLFDTPQEGRVLVGDCVTWSVPIGNVC
ncbi:hypothetical protein FKM82_014792 [Ascaphus truei]